jgi:hypothetical protein
VEAWCLLILKGAAHVRVIDCRGQKVARGNFTMDSTTRSPLACTWVITRGSGRKPGASSYSRKRLSPPHARTCGGISLYISLALYPSVSLYTVAASSSLASHGAPDCLRILHRCTTEEEAARVYDYTGTL